jgi:predicted nucleotidyltransferase
MPMNRESLIAGAQDFIAFLVRTLDRELLDAVGLILLFGSAVRGEATGKSDIDLFIDVRSREADVEAAVDTLVEEFSVRTAIKNPISLKVGKLSEWKDLHPALITDALILYGKYKPEVVEGDHCVIFSWDNTALTESKRVLLHRTLYGYNRRGKQYTGVLQQYGGEKLSPGSILFPLECLHVFKRLFHDFKIAARFYQVVRN